MQETDFAGKVFVFTGVLHKLSRKEVATIVEDMGAIFKDNVTKKTNYLVIGDYAASKRKIKGDKSGKQRRAEELIEQGQDLQILSENEFYEIAKNGMEKLEAEKHKVHIAKLAELDEEMKHPLPVESTICFDTETTGLDPEENGIVDLAILSGDGKVLFNHRLNPGNVKWTWRASSVNKIFEEDVKDELTIDECRPILQFIFRNAKTIIGYNTEFDLHFLEAAGIKWRDDAEIVDVMKEYARVVGDWDDYHGNYRYQKLTKCADAYGYEWQGEAHGALADTMATLYCYPRVRSDYDEEMKKPTPSAELIGRARSTEDLIATTEIVLARMKAENGNAESDTQADIKEPWEQPIAAEEKSASKSSGGWGCATTTLMMVVVLVCVLAKIVF